MELPEHLREEAIGFLVKEHFFQLPFVTHMWRERRTDFIVKLIASLKSANFSPGQVVVEVGDLGTEMFIVISGEMHVREQTPSFFCNFLYYLPSAVYRAFALTLVLFCFVFQVVNGHDQFLCSLTVGDHFGEFAAFGVTAERAATVVAGAHSTAYIITPAALACVRAPATCIHCSCGGGVWFRRWHRRRCDSHRRCLGRF